MPIAVDKDGVAKFQKYSYNLQEPLDVALNGSSVDLSSEATIDGAPTEFRWFIDRIKRY